MNLALYANNRFYQGRMIIRSMMKAFPTYQTDTLAVLYAIANGFKDYQAELDEFNELCKYYVQHKTLTLDDLFK